MGGIMEKTVVVSGNREYGLAKALEKVFPTAQFYSRSQNNFDLSKYDDRIKFAELSLNYDVYISCSCLSQFRQTLLLEKVYKKWREVHKKGYIICLGSTADTPVKGTEWIYPIEKKALKAYCRNLSLASLGGHGNKPSGIRITYVSPGYLDTPKANEKHPDIKKINLNYLAETILWLTQQPPQVNISELALDPIQ